MGPRVAMAIAAWRPPRGARWSATPQQIRQAWSELGHAWTVLHELVMAAAEEDRRARS